MEQEEAISALGALAHDTRLTIYRALMRSEPVGLSAGEIAKVAHASATAVSFHLKELVRAGLIRSWRDGRFVRYRIELDGMRQLLGFLMDDCCGGHPEICSAQVNGSGKARCSPLREDQMENDEAYHVLFLCTHNSARSVIGEALMNSLGQGAFVAYSAGSTPRGTINPFALKILSNHGHKTSGLRSKSWDEFTGEGAPEIDFVFTLCDDAAAETCPVWPGNPITEHWGMPDPSAAEGTDSNKLAAFANTYSLLHYHVSKFVNLAKQELDEKSMRRQVKDFSAEVRRRNVMGADALTEVEKG
ncbi:MAG: metalloregulator ArsR/SmtB family transcription factor [Filomicrobium sp.]